MNEIVDRGARAVFEVLYGGDRAPENRIFASWESYNAERPACAAQFRDVVRAVLGAVREPTEAMLDAAFCCYLDSDTWRAMIDAALKE